MQRPLWPGVSLWLSLKALEAAGLAAQVAVPAGLLVAVPVVVPVVEPVPAVAAILRRRQIRPVQWHKDRLASGIMPGITCGTIGA